VIIVKPVQEQLLHARLAMRTSSRKAQPVFPNAHPGSTLTALTVFLRALLVSMAMPTRSARHATPRNVVSVLTLPQNALRAMAQTSYIITSVRHHALLQHQKSETLAMTVLAAQHALETLQHVLDVQITALPAPVVPRVQNAMWESIWTPTHA
jgi:hypothetical protein